MHVVDLASRQQTVQAKDRHRQPFRYHGLDIGDRTTPTMFADDLTQADVLVDVWAGTDGESQSCAAVAQYLLPATCYLLPATCYLLSKLSLVWLDRGLETDGGRSREPIQHQAAADTEAFSGDCWRPACGWTPQAAPIARVCIIWQHRRWRGVLLR